MTKIWILIIAFVTTASPTPVIPVPQAFADERSCQTAMRSMSAIDLQPFVPPGQTVIAVRSACLEVRLPATGRT